MANPAEMFSKAYKIAELVVTDYPDACERTLVYSIAAAIGVTVSEETDPAFVEGVSFHLNRARQESLEEREGEA